MHLLLLIFIILCVLASMYLFLWGNSFKMFAAKLWYQGYYYLLGTKALMEDWLNKSCNNIDELPKRSGHVAVVTGGARGMGVEVVKILLQCYMHVVVGCRNVVAGDKMVNTLRSSGVNTGTVQCYELDLTSLTSVSSFADKVLKNHASIQLLINNAGIMFVPQSITEDGFESHFQVNYLSHCLLIHHLLPALERGGKKDSKSRIVNVSSCALFAGKINFDDISYLKGYIPQEAYAQSKLAQVLFTKALNKHLISKSSHVQVHAVHPGIVDTELFNGTVMKIIPWVPRLFFKTPKQGATSIIYAGISPTLEGRGGNYISNCCETGVSEEAACEKTQEKLWSSTLSMLKLETFGS